MTRLLYDQFGKQLLKELLEGVGQVETSLDVTAEVRQIDFFFVPRAGTEQQREALGLLGRLVTGRSAFEPFRNPVQPREIRSCIAKLYDLHASLDRQQVRQNKPLLDEGDLPQLWILSPTASAKILEGFRAEEHKDWPRGVYLFGPSSKAAVIVIHQLPVVPETLWLRMLGKGSVQKQAITELRALPEENQFRLNALELVYNLLSILDARKDSEDLEDLEDEDRELLMELSSLYTERLETATQQGQRLMLESILQAKFALGDSPAQTLLQGELNQIIDALMQLPALESSQLIMQLSREELLERFRPLR